MSDQIAEIRARHETDDRWRLTTSMICPGAHDDRATLLAEVERLTRERDEARAEVDNLYDQIHRWVDDRAKAQLQADRLRDQNYELHRERDEARAALKPFASLFLWPDDLDASSAADIRAEEDWSQAENDARSDDLWVRRGDIRAARKATEAKP